MNRWLCVKSTQSAGCLKVKQTRLELIQTEVCCGLGVPSLCHPRWAAESGPGPPPPLSLHVQGVLRHLLASMSSSGSCCCVSSLHAWVRFQHQIYHSSLPSPREKQLYRLKQSSLPVVAKTTLKMGQPPGPCLHNTNPCPAEMYGLEPGL